METNDDDDDDDVDDDDDEGTEAGVEVSDDGDDDDSEAEAEAGPVSSIRRSGSSACAHWRCVGGTPMWSSNRAADAGITGCSTARCEKEKNDNQAIEKVSVLRSEFFHHCASKIYRGYRPRDGFGVCG